MFDIFNNFASAIVGLIIIILIVLALKSIHHQKKACGGNCSYCQINCQKSINQSSGKK